MFGLPNIEQSISKFLEGKNGITSIRSVDWDKKYLWVVDFKDTGANACNPPAPFDDFFPANDITIPMATMESKIFDFPQMTVKIPVGQTVSDITITFYDDEKKSLLLWLRDWINLDLMNDGRFVSGLLDKHPLVTGSDSFGVKRNVKPIRPLRVAMLDSYRDEVQVYQFQVYPDGNLDWNAGQASDAQSYTITFTVVDVKSEKDRKSFSVFSLSGIKETLGRFI